MKLSIATIIFALSFSSLSQAASFSGVTQFSSVEVSGIVHLTCQDNTRSDFRTVSCFQNTLDPFEFGYFQYDKEIDADKVVLERTRNDGKHIKRTFRWNSSKNKSTKRVNLWVDTLFQKGLLDEGDNTINYTFLKNGKSIDEGDFSVIVSRATPRRCAPRSMFSRNLGDCQGSGGIVCTDYFRASNWCK